MEIEIDLIRKSTALCAQGDYEGSVKLLSHGLDALGCNGCDQAVVLVACDLAIQCETFGHYDLGIRHLKDLLKFFPQDSGMLWHLAKLLMLSGQFDDASRVVDMFGACAQHATTENCASELSKYNYLQEELSKKRNPNNGSRDKM